MTTHQGRNVPTVGGMLLFGESRERHFPDGWIQAGRFHGVDKSRIVDGTEIRAHLIRAVEQAIAFVEKHALHGADIGNVRRRERWSIPTSRHVGGHEFLPGLAEFSKARKALGGAWAPSEPFEHQLLRTDGGRDSLAESPIESRTIYRGMPRGRPVPGTG